jgi:hypothetical protein
VPGRPEIVRLVALAAFISVVAVATWLAELSRTLVIVVMAAALAVAWAIEWLAWRETRLRLAQAALAEERDEDEDAPFEEPFEPLEPFESAEPAEPTQPAEPAAVAEPARPERSWFLLKRAPAGSEPNEAPPKRPLAPVAPVVEGRARVIETDDRRKQVRGEGEDAEPVAVEPHEPEAEEAPPAEDQRPPLRPVLPSPAPAQVPREDSGVVNLAARARGPRTWNLWELERLAREEFEGETLEQSQYLFIHLRQFARADGQLPLEFDELVRDSFGGLLERLQQV